MRRRSVIALLIAVGVAVAVLAGVAFASRDSAPSPAVDAELRAAVAKYAAALHLVRPARFYGKTLTLSRCIGLMHDYEHALDAAAAGPAARFASDYAHLRQLRWDEARVRHYRGPDALPIGWTARVVYWRSPHGRGDTYTVRAAAYETMVTAVWDGSRLTRVRRKEYADAPIADYTLQRLGGVWKVVRVAFWRPDGYDRLYVNGHVERMVP